MIYSDKRVAHITNDDGAKAIAAGVKPVFVVGFPLSDVYRYPEGSDVSDGSDVDWGELSRRFEYNRY